MLKENPPSSQFKNIRSIKLNFLKSSQGGFSKWQAGSRKGSQEANQLISGLTCPYTPVFRGGKHVPLWDNYGCNAQDTNHNQVDEARLRVAIEGVVQPWYEAAHYEECNARIIQPRRKQKSVSWEVRTFGNPHTYTLLCLVLTATKLLSLLQLKSWKQLFHLQWWIALQTARKAIFETHIRNTFSSL